MGSITKIITTITKSVLLFILISGQSYSQEIDAQPQIFFVLNELSSSHSQFYLEFDKSVNPELLTLEKLDIKDFNDSVKRQLDDNDIIITVGTQVFEQALKLNLPNPIWVALIPAQSYYTLVNSYSHRHTKAWFIDQPIKRRIALVKTVLPDVSKYGVLVNDSFQYQLNNTVKEFTDNDLELVVKRVPVTDSPIKSSQELFSRIDALFTLVDPKILNRNTAKSILLSSYRRNIPVIAYSNSYVQAGALAAVYSSPVQLARQLAEDVKNSIESDNYQMQDSQYPKYFSVSFNKNVARSLSIKPLDEEVIHKKVNQYNND